MVSNMKFEKLTARHHENGKDYLKQDGATTSSATWVLHGQE